jgi:hypothetical protein
LLLNSSQTASCRRRRLPCSGGFRPRVAGFLDCRNRLPLYFSCSCLSYRKALAQIRRFCTCCNAGLSKRSSSPLGFIKLCCQLVAELRCCVFTL